MKKLTLVVAALVLAPCTFAQTTTNLTSPFTIAYHSNQVSTAAQPSARVSATTESKGGYIREIAQEKRDQLNHSKETAKALAKERKEQAKQLRKDQKVVDTEQDVLTQEAAVKDAAFAQSDGNELAFSQEKRQDNKKARKEKSAKAEKENTKDKTKKEQNQKVSPTAKETLQTGRGKGQDVKEVASAKRQSKPEKVEATAEVDVNAAVKTPKSAARPGRGAARSTAQGATSTANKTVGNAAKAVKPVKVGAAVGVGKVMKVGKN